MAQNHNLEFKPPFMKTDSSLESLRKKDCRDHALFSDRSGVPEVFATPRSSL